VLISIAIFLKKLLAILRLALNGPANFKNNIRLARLRGSIYSKQPGDYISFSKYKIRINDQDNFYNMYKDIFIKQIYYFEAHRPDPLILDCGSNIGMSILYFKELYPRAHVIGFEPDPTIFPFIKENIINNNIEGVELFQKALCQEPGYSKFLSDGKYGSFLLEKEPDNIPPEWFLYNVQGLTLKEFLSDPVDFLKMNIEGAEWEVLADTGENLRQIREMVIEYHHLPHLPRTLHKILSLLYSLGFDYLINDNASDEKIGLHPSSRLKSDGQHFLLIYARRQN
jgi:FkbM family methyltransferase